MVARKRSIKTVPSDNPTQNEAPTVSDNLSKLATFAASVEESDEAIKRTSTRNKYADNPFAPHVLRSRESGKVMAISVPAHAVKEVINHLRAAAKEARHGLRMETVPKSFTANDTAPVKVKFQAAEKKDTGHSDAQCPECGKQVSVTATGNLRTHGARNNRCKASGNAV